MLAYNKEICLSFEEREGYILHLKKFEKTNKLRYRNELNSITFPKFTAQDFDLFFVICFFVLKNKNRNFTTIHFDNFREFFPQIKNKQRFYKEILIFVRKKLKFVGVDMVKFENTGRVDSGAAFVKDYILDEEKETLSIKLNNFGYSMLFHFGDFMSFDLNEFCSLKNKYSKSLFRLLKEYENTNFSENDKKVITMQKTEFTKFINAPLDYKISSLDNYVLKPSIDELNKNCKSFENVEYKKIYDINAKENSKKKVVTGFKILFQKTLQ